MEEGVEATSGTYRDLQRALSTDNKSEKMNRCRKLYRPILNGVKVVKQMTITL